jgi:DNA-binding MarR family transcriptional regulator
VEVPEVPGYVIALLLTGSFRALVDEVHAELAKHGHPDVRPAHGFALRAIGSDGATAVELGQRLGVTKQGAGKTMDALEQLGYITRTVDTIDGRRRIASITPRGREMLALSAAAFDRVVLRWRDELGPDVYDSLVEGLSQLGRGQMGSDLRSWLT